jgi:hypothetical protein
MSKDNERTELPRYIVKAIVEYRMPDYENDNDWVIARDIENDFDFLYSSHNQIVNGKPFKYSFNSQHEIDLIISRIDEILHQKFNRPLSQSLKEFKISLQGKTQLDRSQDNAKYIQERKKAEKIVRLTVLEVSKIYRERFKSLPRDWEPKITMDWSPRRVRCWGGYNSHKDTGIYGVYGGISLSMGTFLNRESRNVRREFLEYSHISKDPVIGGFLTESWEMQLMAVTCHECAHAAQFYYWHNIDQDPKYKVPHGYGFQLLYRMAREEVTNPRLKKAGIKIGIANENEKFIFED